MELNRRVFLCGAGGAAANLLLSGCGSSSGGGSGEVISPFPGATPIPVPGQPRLSSLDVAKIAIAGSSSAELYLNQYTGPETNNNVLVSNDGVAYGPLQTGAFGKTAGTVLASELNKPVCFLRGGKSGATIAEWATPNSVLRTALVRSIVSAGGVDAVLLQAGRNDAFLRQVRDLDTEVSVIREAIYRLRLETGIPDLMVFIGGVQRGNGFDQQQSSQISIHRAAEMIVISRDPNVRYGFSTYDLTTFDGIHQTEASQRISGQRFAEQCNAWMDKTEEFRGPRIVNLAAISDTETELEFANWKGSSIAFRRAVKSISLYDQRQSQISITEIKSRDRKYVRIMHESMKGSFRESSYNVDNIVSDQDFIYDDSVFSLPMEPFIGFQKS